MFSGVMEKFLVGVSSCSSIPLLVVGVSKLSPERFFNRSFVSAGLSKFIHKLLLFRIEKSEGLCSEHFGLSVGLVSAVGVLNGDGFVGDSGDFGSPQRSARLSHACKTPSWFS